ncbi:MAG TPA: carboxypeptidase-like regulatory domain-containing protein, partial [Blastocatellia bacterium]
YGSPETPGRQSARTDENGRYEFKGLAAGRYGLIAASYTYANADLLTSQRGNPFKLCAVAAGEKLEGQDITLKRGGAITGRITGADGGPVIVERVQLTFVDPTDKQQAFPAPVDDEMWLTDDRGVYRLFGLPPGRYLVGAGREIGQGGFGSSSGRGFYRRVYYPDASEVEQAKLIEVKEGGEVTDIDIRLGPPEQTFTVSGRAIDATDGKPIPRALLDFGPADKRTKKAQSRIVGSPANERGEFRYGGLPPGRYVIGGSHDPARNYYGEPVEFEVKDEDIKSLDVKLSRGASISGAVLIEGVADPAAMLRSARIWIIPRSLEQERAFENRGLAPATVEPNGSFQIKALPPERIRLEVGGEGAKLHLSRVEREGAEVRDAFKLNPGEQVMGVRVVLAQATGALRGRVNLPSPLPDGSSLELTLRPVGGGEQSERPLQLDMGAGFVAQTLPAGDYEIIVKLKNIDSGGNQASVEVSRRRVNVRDGATTEIVLTVEPPR